MYKIFKIVLRSWVEKNWYTYSGCVKINLHTAILTSVHLEDVSWVENFTE